MHAKNQCGSPAQYGSPVQIFSAGFISVSRDFTPYFHFRCVARATFDKNLIHSADACFLVMACVGYSPAQLKTLSSLLKQKKRTRITQSGKNCAMILRHPGRALDLKAKDLIGHP